MEAKSENVIDRIKGTAAHGGLRHMERVKAGVEFNFDIRVKILDKDKDKEENFKSMIKQGLNLVEADYLGGSGSRGYGKVKFSNKENWEIIYPAKEEQ